MAMVGKEFYMVIVLAILIVTILIGLFWPSDFGVDELIVLDELDDLEED